MGTGRCVFLQGRVWTCSAHRSRYCFRCCLAGRHGNNDGRVQAGRGGVLIWTGSSFPPPPQGPFPAQQGPPPASQGLPPAPQCRFLRQNAHHLCYRTLDLCHEPLPQGQSPPAPEDPITCTTGPQSPAPQGPITCTPGPNHLHHRAPSTSLQGI